jgi:hypothetical protein
VQDLCGSGETSLPRHSDEIAKMAQLHRHTSQVFCRPT